MNIEKGDFVCMWRTGIPEWWCEVMVVLPRGQARTQEYQVRYWSNEKNKWGYFNLSPEIAHRGIVKEVRKIPPEVVPMFRDLFIKGVKHD